MRLIIGLCLLLFVAKVKAQILMNNNTAVTINCPSTNTFFDSGGSGGQYANSQNFTKTFTSNNGSCLQVVFTAFATESCCDRLRIYDGPSGASPLIGTYAGNTSPGTIISTGSSLTFSWTSDGSVLGNGWEANISCVAPCSGAAGGTAGASPATASCSALNTTLSVTGSSSGCGTSYQWQSATALAGPYTNIAGATSATYTQNVVATTYFQRITTCGGSSATSAPATVSISCNAYIQSNINETITCPPTYSLFYDSGGPGAQYANNENLTKTFTSSNGNCLQFAFTTFTTESCCDRLMIFDGPSGASPLIGTYAGGSSPGTIISSGSSLTFSFTSDGSVVRDGWEATISCVAPCVGAPAAGAASASPNYSLCASYNTTVSVAGSSTGCGLTYQWQSATAIGGPYSNISGATSATYTQNISSTTFLRRVTTCGGSSSNSSPATASLSCTGYIQGNSTETLTCPPALSFFYDSKGPSAQYGNSENLTKTFVSSNGNCLQFAFTTFTTEAGFDVLRIYDGPSGASPLIGTYSGGNSPGTVISSGSSITFSFTSDGSGIRDGWEATISCVAPCTGTPNSGTAFATPSSSCSAFSTTLDVSGSAAGCGMTYQWQSASAVGGPYTNIAGATRPTYTQNITATTFFRRITTCGAASATSAIGTASITTPVLSCDLNTYTASATTYSFESFSGTALPTTDDVLFSSVTLFGFNFCFGGQQFIGGYVASNSSFVFDAFPCNPNILTNTYAAPGVGTGYSISQAAPSVNTSIPRNAILAPWHDIHPNNTATVATSKIQYITLGTAPNRRTIISWENIPYFSCSGGLTPFFTGQIKLFETSNIIEIHIKDKVVCSSFNGGYAVMGLHNFNGTIYVPPVNNTAHNYPTQWTMSNAGYRFQTNCSAVCSVPLSVEFKNFYGQQIDEINKLWWETGDEKDVKEFIVERSTDAQNFLPVYSVAAKGNPSSYLFNDNAYAKGYINYYKVTAVEFGGKRTSTPPIPIFNTNDKVLVKSVYPNPAHEKLAVGILGRSVYAECAFTIYDQLGKIVLQQNNVIKFGDNTIDVDIETLQSGVYILELKSSDNQLINRQKFTKL